MHVHSNRNSTQSAHRQHRTAHTTRATHSAAHTSPHNTALTHHRTTHVPHSITTNSPTHTPLFSLPHSQMSTVDADRIALHEIAVAEAEAVLCVLRAKKQLVAAKGTRVKVPVSQRQHWQFEGTAWEFVVDLSATA